MRWLDKIISQNIEGTRSNDQCTEGGMEYNEDSRGDEYNSHGDKGNNPKSKHQQPNHKCYQHPRNIRGLVMFNSKQHEKLGISNSKNTS